ncbi:MAG: T9SS type A sorting domain-containing protein [Bacteroidetes bacterium]|nr:T9SS type A sorting domain-containing protein [Bacteroidota bacterium]
MNKPYIFATMLAMVSICTAFNAVPTLTVVYDAGKKAVRLRWQQANGIKAYTIQRSDNNSTWADIALQMVAPGTTGKAYEYYDYRSSSGENYYRLKCQMEDGTTQYSTSIMVITSSGAGNWVMYPVPVKDVLTLQYKGTERIMGVVNVFIQNVNGKIITRVRSASVYTTIRIPVDNLGSGVYDVRIVIGDDVVWNQRFIK